MFWTCMGCFSLTIILITFGARAKEITSAATFFFAAALTSTHFVWYFNVLGGAL